MTWTCAGCACNNPDANAQCMICLAPRDPGGFVIASEGVVVGADVELGLQLAEVTDLDIATLSQAEGETGDAAADGAAAANDAELGPLELVEPLIETAHLPLDADLTEDDELLELSAADVAVDRTALAQIVAQPIGAADPSVPMPELASLDAADIKPDSGFFGAPTEMPAMPLFDLELAAPSAKPRRASRQDMTSMLQEFSVMFRVDDRARRRKAWAARIAVLGLIAVGGIVGARWWAQRPSDVLTPTVDLVADLRPPHSGSTEYVLIDRRMQPATSERFRVSALSARLADVCAMAGLRQRHVDRAPASAAPASAAPAAAGSPDAGDAARAR